MKKPHFLYKKNKNFLKHTFPVPIFFYCLLKITIFNELPMEQNFWNFHYKAFYQPSGTNFNGNLSNLNEKLYRIMGFSQEF